MRLEAERPPDPRHRRLRHPTRRGHRPGRPVRRVSRGLLQRLDDHSFHIVIADRARRTRTRFIDESVEATLDEPGAPLADRRPVHAQTARRPRCSIRPRRRPTRSGTATPTPAQIWAGAPNVRASHARQSPSTNSATGVPGRRIVASHRRASRQCEREPNRENS